MPKPKRLHKQIAEMIVIETTLNALLGDLAQRSEANIEVSTVLRECEALSAVQLEALQSRFAKIGGNEFDVKVNLSGRPEHSEDYPVTAALSRAAAELNRTVFGYAMLRSVALRSRDSSLIGAENTGDLAEQHTRNYVHALHQINRILHNAVLWELDQDGEECQCTCPACGIGICMCAQGPRRTLSDIWAEAGPISDETSVLVHKPRRGSAAAEAGLKGGDRILAADSRELATHFVLQEVVSGHSAGEPIRLRVKRTSDDVEDVTVVRRQRLE